MSTKHFAMTFPFCVLLIVCFSSSSATPLPKLGIVERDPVHDAISENGLSTDFQAKFYDQTLDHFNFQPKSYTKFKQYYVINSKHWGGPKSGSPIFAYLGAEAPLDGDIPSIGALTDNAHRFKALLVYIEHRFYGKSNPVGSMDKSLEDKEMRGYFNSAQALADYAEILVDVKQKLSAQNSPVIVFGGSYGGMLASWFRLKYPHIAVGAFASSAPILYFDDITPQNGYYSKVTQDFKEVSENCYRTITESWSAIDEVASKPRGLTRLSQKFKTCERLKASAELKDYLDSTYASSAQYNAPPTYPVTKFCSGVDGAPKGDKVVDRIIAGLVSLKGNLSCFDTREYSSPSQTLSGWRWQTCSDLVIPIGRGSNDTMFPAAPFVLSDFVRDCRSRYGVSPRPHWITTYYGGKDIKLILKKFGSNIIFSNGLRDPYSTGGVLENLSSSLVAVYTKKGSHCLDILPARKDDPGWLVAQRKTEVEIVEAWIKAYYADLHTKIKHI